MGLGKQPGRSARPEKWKAAGAASRGGQTPKATPTRVDGDPALALTLALRPRARQPTVQPPDSNDGRSDNSNISTWRCPKPTTFYLDAQTCWS
jgi:hypothetical protein